MLEKLLIKVGRHGWDSEVRDAATGEVLMVTRVQLDPTRETEPQVTLTLIAEVEIETESGEVVRYRMSPGGTLTELDRIQVGV